MAKTEGKMHAWASHLLVLGRLHRACVSPNRFIHPLAHCPIVSTLVFERTSFLSPLRFEDHVCWKKPASLGPFARQVVAKVVQGCSLLAFLGSLENPIGRAETTHHQAYLTTYVAER